MYAIRFFFLSLKISTVKTTYTEQIDYFLLVLSTLFIAAAGNVINDYFDIKSDQINKPNKLIISTYISTHKAQVFYWILNILALLIGAYLSIHKHTFWYISINIATILLLFYYSYCLKKIFFIGNIVVAFLTSLVIILCGIYFNTLSNRNLNLFLDNCNLILLNNVFIHWKDILFKNNNYLMILIYFSFFLNLCREIIKDIEDIKGDLLLNAKTIPIIININRSKWIVIIILTTIPIGYFYILKNAFFKINSISYLITLPLFISTILVIISQMMLLTNANSNSLKTIGHLLKIAMLVGVLSPFYWYLI